MHLNALKKKALPSGGVTETGSSGQKFLLDPLKMWPFPKTFNPYVPHYNPPIYERVTLTSEDMKIDPPW